MPDARRVLAGGAALLAVAGAGCGGDKADLTEPAMALPRLTVAMVAVDLRAGGQEGDEARALARAAGYRTPLILAGPAARAVAPDAAGRAALFLLPARDGTGLNSGAVVETRDEHAALDAARRVRPLVRAERAPRGAAPRARRRGPRAPRPPAGAPRAPRARRRRAGRRRAAPRPRPPARVSDR